MRNSSYMFPWSDVLTFYCPFHAHILESVNSFFCPMRSEYLHSRFSLRPISLNHFYSLSSYSVPKSLFIFLLLQHYFSENHSSLFATDTAWFLDYFRLNAFSTRIVSSKCLSMTKQAGLTTFITVSTNSWLSGAPQTIRNIVADVSQFSRRIWWLTLTCVLFNELSRTVRAKIVVCCDESLRPVWFSSYYTQCW